MRAIKTNNRQNKLDVITFMTFGPYFCSFWGSLIINNTFVMWFFSSSLSLLLSLCLSLSLLCAPEIATLPRFDAPMDFEYMIGFSVENVWASFVDPSFYRPHRYEFHNIFVLWLRFEKKKSIFLFCFVFIRWKMRWTVLSLHTYDYEAYKHTRISCASASIWSEMS